MKGDKDDEQKKSGVMGQIAVVAVLTLVAAGTGWALGSFVLTPSAPAQAVKVEMDQPEDKKKTKEIAASDEDSPIAMSGHVVDLPPITANIATPADTWLRLELAVLFTEAPGYEMPEKIHQDIVAFVQTLKLYQMEGASGMRHLRQDMDELARIRSGGTAKNVLIRAMLLE